jgi:hypothetical protein
MTVNNTTKNLTSMAADNLLFKQDGKVDKRCKAHRNKTAFSLPAWNADARTKLKHVVAGRLSLAKTVKDTLGATLLFKKNGDVDKRCQAYRRGLVGTTDLFRKGGGVDQRTKIYKALRRAIDDFTVVAVIDRANAIHIGVGPRAAKKIAA